MGHYFCTYSIILDPRYKNGLIHFTTDTSTTTYLKIDLIASTAAAVALAAGVPTAVEPAAPVGARPANQWVAKWFQWVAKWFNV